MIAISHLKLCDLEIYNINNGVFSMAMTFNLLAVVMFALSLTIYEIFAKKVKYKKIDLENGQG